MTEPAPTALGRKENHATSIEAMTIETTNQPAKTRAWTTLKRPERTTGGR
ncbi:Uncharacterised protein [Mycobacteroides abscessus subsp. abscessus]|nr:Uncharacterised protein [Mycobacteroides abscessus subsp. abscessus]